MLQALRKRLHNDEEGFTLIELMVVVLIIAILIAIAIRTFLGARGRANNRAAQANLRNALTAEKTLFTDSQTWGAAAAVQVVEPSLTFQDNAAAVTQDASANQVAVDTVTTAGTLYLGTKAKSGTCYYLMDNGTAGTQYALDAACAKASAPAGGYKATAQLAGW